jgi:hypothetical protein
MAFVDVAGQSLSFLPSSKVLIVGDGTNPGDQVLYRDVFSGVDALVSVDYSQDVGSNPIRGITMFDTPDSGKEAPFFSTTIDPDQPNPGFATFKFQFYKSGTFGTDGEEAEAASLSNFYANVYDIDGRIDSSRGVPQFVDATGFTQYSLSDATLLRVSAGPGDSTRFESQQTEASPSSSGGFEPEYRLQLYYEQPVSEISFNLGASPGVSGSFRARFDIDFSAGDVFANTVTGLPEGGSG